MKLQKKKQSLSKWVDDEDARMVLGQSEVWTVGAGGQQEDTLAGSGHTGPTKSQFYIKFITRRDGQ